MSRTKESGIQEYLQQVSFPYLRRLRESGNGEWPRIEIGSDSMRMGKTTAADVIAGGLVKMGFPVALSLEDWQNNPYLKASYSDPTEAFVKSQEWFARRKYEQVSAAGFQETISIQDVHPEMDYCYALTNDLLGRVGNGWFLGYDQFYRGLGWEGVQAPDLLVYLTASDDVLIQRAQVSVREFEMVEAEYFLTMKEINRAWLDGVGGYVDVLEINTDDFDFSLDEGAKNRLVKMVVESVGISR